MTTIVYNASTVTFRSPALGDIRKPYSRGLIKRSRDTTLYGYLYRSPNHKLTLKFGDIRRTLCNVSTTNLTNTIASILTFLKSSVGHAVTMTLDDATVWHGYILNETFETTEVGRFNSTFELHFEGKQVIS